MIRLDYLCHCHCEKIMIENVQDTTDVLYPVSLSIQRVRAISQTIANFLKE